jgi:hypothetical protein
MAISFEMSQILEKLKYDDYGNWDTLFYNICRKLYHKEKLNFQEMLHINALENKRKDLLFNYINICIPCIKNEIMH